MKKIPPSELKRAARRIRDTNMLTAGDAQLLLYAMAQVLEQVAKDEDGDDDPQ